MKVDEKLPASFWRLAWRIRSVSYTHLNGKESEAACRAIRLKARAAREAMRTIEGRARGPAKAPSRAMSLASPRPVSYTHLAYLGAQP